MGFKQDTTPEEKSESTPSCLVNFINQKAILLPPIITTKQSLIKIKDKKATMLA